MLEKLKFFVYGLWKNGLRYGFRVKLYFFFFLFNYVNEYNIVCIVIDYVVLCIFCLIFVVNFCFNFVKRYLFDDGVGCIEMCV